MARPRVRFCPYGHDKDAKGGSSWSEVKTFKGTITHRRRCNECNRRIARNYYAKAERMETGIQAEYMYGMRSLSTRQTVSEKRLSM